MPLQNSPLAQLSPQPFGLQTFPQLFLNDVQMQLVNNVSNLSKDRCFWSKHTTEDLLTWIDGDQIVALSIPSLNPNDRYQKGGGSYNTQLDGLLLARIFVRNEGDFETRDIVQMRDQVFGDLGFVQQIITAFQTWVGPVDPATGMSLFNRPMLLSGSVTEAQKSGKNGRWSYNEARFQLPFVADLKYPYPGPVSPPSPPPAPVPPPPVILYARYLGKGFS